MPSCAKTKKQPVTEEYLISSTVKAIIMEIGKEITSNPTATPKELAEKMYNPNLNKKLAKLSPSMNALINIITSGVVHEFSSAPMNDFLTLLASVENLTGIKGFVTSCIQTYASSHAKKLASALGIS